jgi:hypothetical protein
MSLITGLQTPGAMYAAVFAPGVFHVEDRAFSDASGDGKNDQRLVVSMRLCITNTPATEKPVIAGSTSVLCFVTTNQRTCLRATKRC